MRGLKRACSMVLIFAMFLSMIPIQTSAAENPLTVIVDGSDGSPVTGATVTATAKGIIGSTTYPLTVEQTGNGVYVIEKADYSSFWYTITINVTAAGYESASTSVRGSTNSTTITMTKQEVREEWVEFEIFYYLNGSEDRPFPDSYAGYGDQGNYGPSGDNTPMVVVNVDIEKLKTYTDAVLYEEDRNGTAEGNYYQFTPIDQNQNMEAAKAFWNAVLECMDEASLQALEDTGLADWLVGYVLKCDTSNACHGDVLLAVTPPVYVVELYKDTHYVGGLVTNTGEDFKTMGQVLDALEGYLGYTITWEEDAQGDPIADAEGNYNGTYIHEKHLHHIAVVQTNLDKAQTIEGSPIKYQELSAYYYVAYFNLQIDEGIQVEFEVDYTDGDAAGTAFYRHSYGVSVQNGQNPKVPAFTGNPSREGYTFLGWILEGGDGTIYTDAEVQAMTVTQDMVFHAEWTPIPLTHIGAVHVILNGTYDAVTHTATGTALPLTELMPGAELYVKAENSDQYIPLVLDPEKTGVYRTALENGEYSIYYSLDGGYTFVLTDDQKLTINDADRHRYLFFNSVEYDLNGGTTEEELPREYYQAGTKNVMVTDQIPTKDRYLFSHWVDDKGNEFASGSLMTEEIGHPRVLTAVYKDAVDVYLSITLNHTAEDGVSVNNDNGKHDIEFTLDQRFGTSDYTEIYRNELYWDGESWFSNDTFQASFMGGSSQITSYNSTKPLLENVAADAEYTFTTDKTGYSYVEVSRTVAENGDIIIHAEMIFDPTTFDLIYTVRLNEEDKNLPAHMRPVAVNVKVIWWCDTTFDADYGLPEGDHTVDWYVFADQRYTYDRVELDENGVGTEHYPVWIETTDSEGAHQYHYRIEVVSYEMADGEVNPATNVDGENVSYLSDCGHVETVVNVSGGKSPDETKTQLQGAYHDGTAQVGQIEAVVYIHTYSVSFDPNGGTLNGITDATVAEPLFQVPDLLNYVPVRGGGYVFDNWYLADENGNMTDRTVNSLDPLHENITLLAKWKEPRTITANVTVNTSYIQPYVDGSVAVHKLGPAERAQRAVVNLQKILENGYPESVQFYDVPLTYINDLGTGTVTFTGVPDDGHEYRILVFIPGYSFTYQNAPESLDEDLKTDYTGSYNKTDFIANFNGAAETTVNTYGSFTPDLFTLQYQVDASAIGSTFRPTNAQILITYDDDTGIIDPEQWPVVSQMEINNQYVGKNTALVGGLGSGQLDVWITDATGQTLDEYALRLQSITTPQMVRPYDENAPYTVQYQVPAYYVAPDGQSQMLIAWLLPRSYTIHYELDGGELAGTYPQAHTWSYDTDLSAAVPAKAGYVFDGWYLDAELTVSAGDKIDMSVHEEVTLYAKWKLAMDRVNVTITLDHTQDNDVNSNNGQAAVYDRILYTYLTSHENGGEGVTYTLVDGTQKGYTSRYWHTMPNGTALEVFTVNDLYVDLPSDMAYSALASMEGYVLVEENCSVTPVENEDSETGTTYEVELYLRYHPQLMDVEFTVRMDQQVAETYDPKAALVKLYSWYDDNNAAPDWHLITQHHENYVEVELDSQTRSGTGSYSAWMWYLKDQNIPFHYRIEVVGLVLQDGTVVQMTGNQGYVTTSGGVYTATVYAENGAAVPTVPVPEGEMTLKGVYGTLENDVPTQNGTLEAVITVNDPITVSFQTGIGNNEVFRTYYSAGAVLPEGGYHLTGNGTAAPFYEIPQFDYETHNNYIFAGWYMGTEEDAEPLSWDQVFTEDAVVYGRWIETGTVNKEEADKKQNTPDVYGGFDLLGLQIRTSDVNLPDHYGTPGAGLRFIAVLSERVYTEINGLHSNNAAGAEYGFVLAKLTAAQAAAAGEDYMIKYKADGVNGEDNAQSYAYVINAYCRLPGKPVADHYAGENYRLYTTVITYNGLTGDTLLNAQNTEFVARPYLRYYDANGLERIHYVNYTGQSKQYGGVVTCYADVYAAVYGK